jgi:hypothetical protein
MAAEYPLPTQATPQQLGSAMTYARRYSLAAICCIASDEDDDAEATRNGGVKVTVQDTAPVVVEQKRDNPHVTRPEDLSDAVPRYDENGKRIDHIPTELHRALRMPKAKAKPLFAELGSAMMAHTDSAELTEWADGHAELVASLPEDWERIMQDRYQEHLDSLRHKAKRAA